MVVAITFGSAVAIATVIAVIYRMMVVIAEIAVVVEVVCSGGRVLGVVVVVV